MYAVDVTIVAKTGTIAYNGFWFVARAADGSNIAPAVGAVQPGITSGQLPAGQQVAAHVAYDVPAGQTITGDHVPRSARQAAGGVGDGVAGHGALAAS